MNKEAIRLKIRKMLIHLTKNSRNKKLKNKDFTIISNNCWGGVVYESLNLEKQSPTVGLFFMADEYIKFLKAFPSILDEELVFIDPLTSKYHEYLEKDKRFGSYPIGHLGDVEICFLHYHSEKEVIEKWKRRCKRINLNKLLVKMNDQNQFEERHYYEFLKLPFENKVFFSVSQMPVEDENTVCIKTTSKQDSICASQEPIIFSRYYNVIQEVNNL